MKRIFALNQTAFAVEDGELKQLGTIDKLEHITGDVFKSSKETFVIKDGKISVLTTDEYPMPIFELPETCVPAEIKDLRDKCQTLISPCGKTPSLCGVLYERYFEMVSKYSAKDFENLVKNAVVLVKHNRARLFIRNKAGEYVEEKDIICIKHEDKPAFIYRGGLYVRDSRGLRFMRIDFVPIIISAGYIIFWGGNQRLWVMFLDGNVAGCAALGSFMSLIKTDVNQLILMEDEFDRYIIYHLGEEIREVASFENPEDYKVDPKNGTVTCYYTFTMEGVDYPETRTYKLINGSYELET